MTADTPRPNGADPDTRQETETREVRAGPGDAGRQDTPEPLPRAPNEGRRGRNATLLLAALILLGVAIYVLT